MSKEDFLSRLDPKIAKSIKTASEIEVIRRPLASRRLNFALGGGIGAGRITTIYGNFSAGKTLLTLQSIGEWQKQGLTCGFIDVEGTYDPEFSARLGVNNDDLFVTGSKSSERISNEIHHWLKAGIDILALDSISDVMPAVFTDKAGELLEADKRKQIGAHSKAIKTIIDGIHYNNEKTAVILLSQTTTKIEATYTKQVPHGGNAVGFNSSTMIKLTSSNTDAKLIKGLRQMGLNKIEVPIGRTVDALVEKNKIGTQSATATYDIYFGGDEIGIDKVGELVDMCVDFGVIKKGGAWFEFESEKIQGRDTMVDKVKEDFELRAELEKRLDLSIYG